MVAKGIMTTQVVTVEPDTPVRRIAADSIPGVRAVEDHMSRVPAGLWAE